MALAVCLLPRLLLSRPLPAWAARLRTPGSAEVKPPSSGLCCFCRRRLCSGAAPFPRVSWASAALALSARGPQRPVLSPLEVAATLPTFPSYPRRTYSTEEQPQQRQKTKMIILGFSNPINWVRTRIYSFLIWAYFDQEFSITEFSEGAKQAFAHVSKLLSQCKFDLLEELVAKETLRVLKEKVTSLPDNHKNALAADIDEIVYTSTGDISIYYDEKGSLLTSWCAFGI
ncbi:m-AAA protease-interacting protein 1, mitochondrial isoform X2 [Cervus elaphus]|uniref:m-AAA protease-interacting protein 1, mitochondrial isoform X2 n=1 Tax=Cervus canadensis TaxID=1574408 RepID=UPI001CA37B97|nr:m-AAA protease-interacting protein 1, mitochondrial isoform X2 [Cervus canadensis]XP_043766393.1 m-AAA protease-interacting protein 1, mitochondrial isoform X2 [Cervus elaphus]